MDNNNTISVSSIISIKMKILLRIVIVFYVCFYQLCDAAYSIPKTVTTQLSASYVLIIREDGIQPTECYINDDKNKYMIDLLHADVQPEPHNKNSDYVNKAQGSDIIKSLGNGICGFKMNNVSKTTTPKWTLTIVDKRGNSYNSSTRVFIEAPSADYTNISMPIGDSVMIPCASLNKDINYCEIYHPNGEVVVSGSETCLFNAPLTKATDFGVWKCLLGYKSNMVPVVKQYELIQIQLNVINTWQNETETRVNLGCSVSNPKLKSNYYCIMVRPDGKQFKLLPGLATDRYTTLNTDLSNYVCSLEIAKPLEANEWGIWRCEVHSGADNPIGGFITLSTRSNRFIRSIQGAEAKVPKDMFLHVNSSMTVSCRVPYSTSYCYMRGPDGTLYPIKDDRAITLGLCTLTKDQVKLSDNGTWFCGFAKRTGEADDVYKFQVYVAEVLTIRPEYELVETRDGGSAYLKCTTQGIGDYPLKYCRFLSPDGHMYQISDKDNSNDRIIYDGRGLEYGDCGIKILKMELSDIGKWTCVTRIGADFSEDEVHTNIDLALSNNLSLASVLGISFGVSLVAVGGAFVGIRKWKQRRVVSRTPSVVFTRNIAQRSSNSSHSSSGSSNVAFNITSRQSIHDQNYDTISPSIRYRVS